MTYTVSSGALNSTPTNQPGRLLSSLARPIGSLVTGTPAVVMAWAMTSLMAWCLAILLGACLHTKPWIPCASTVPHNTLLLLRTFINHKFAETTNVLCGQRWQCGKVTCLSIYTLIVKTHTHPFNGPFSGTTRVSRYQRGKTNVDFTEARDDERQWHQLGHMQVCNSLQTDNHASTPPVFYRPDALPVAQPTA